ncbi:MAG: hypothetical protein AAGH70_11940 [Pseudomonadota bacterium]
MIRIFACVAALTLAAPALANNTFGGLFDAREGATYYDIKLVRTLGPGFVELRDSRGRLLGRESVRAGTNTRVRIDLGADRVPPVVAYAVLIVDGEIVDRDRVRVFR